MKHIYNQELKGSLTREPGN